MLEYTGENPATPQSPIGSLFKTVAILRIGTGTLLLTRHALAALPAAYHFLWNNQPWDWATFMAENGVPYAHLVAPAVALLVGLVAVFWVLGFLTRFFAVVFLPIAAGALVLAQKVGSPMVETCWLYIFAAITLLLFGSGAISLDKLFNLGQRPKKKKKPSF